MTNWIFAVTVVTTVTSLSVRQMNAFAVTAHSVTVKSHDGV